MIHKTPDSPARTRRARRKDARAEDLLRTAAELLVSEGYDAFTMHRLAGELDYAVGALYRYFPSKDAILAELQSRALVALGRMLQERLGKLAAASARLNPKVAALARVLAAAETYRAFAASEPEQFRLLALTLGDPRERLQDAQAKRVIGAAVPLFATWAEELEAAARAGALVKGPAGDRAVVLWVGVHGALMLGKLARLEPTLFAPDRQVDEAVRALLQGWGADPKLVARAAVALEELTGNRNGDHTR